ncbi:MAG: hypothetical protein D6719_04160 [Candidatus Dadabacteria bacterium]|nr:MAG: hypothetical protein D6719_04160 [Candidatus Dadabacteria bacterium]
MTGVSCKVSFNKFFSETNRKNLFQLLLLLLAALGFYAAVKNTAPSGNNSLNAKSVEIKNRDDSRVRASLRLLRQKKRRKNYGDPAQYITLNTRMAYKGLTLLPLSGAEQIWLINTDGKLINRWDIDADRARLLPNGHILVLHGSKFAANREPWKTLRRTVAEYDWEGNVVWQHSGDHILHHDTRVLSNGNVIFVSRYLLNGAALGSVTDPLRKEVNLKADALVELNRSGEIVWQWNSWEHFDLNFCGVFSCEKRVAEHKQALNNNDYRLAKKLRDWTHTNTVSEIPPNRWYRQGDKRFKPGNLIVMPRNFWTLYIIDKESGDIVWQYSKGYKDGLGGAHEAYMIPEGLPGAGNILLLDNGSKRRHPKESYILEINPVTKKPVWVYDRGPEFHCPVRGAAIRLPNGNTFVSNDPNGVLFEITPEGEKVWEMKPPSHISRAHKYPYSYCKVCKESSGS